MRTLVFITSNFPFGQGETFIESEFPFLADNFEKIIVVAQNVTAEKTRQIPGNVILKRYDTSTGAGGFLRLPVLLLRNYGVIKEMISSEYSFRGKTGDKITSGRFLILLKKIIKAVQLRDFIERTLASNGIGGNIVFYSYWLKTGAHSIAMLDYPDSIKISRAHGSDLYEERTQNGYLPLLDYTAKNLDSVFFISEHGRRYFTGKLKEEKSHFNLSRLGVENQFGPCILPGSIGKLVIASCSNLIPLKRINLIIEALAQTNSDTNIEWLHFGDGLLRKELESLAESRLNGLKHVSFRFMGFYANHDLMRFYSENHIDLFINTSSTEGLPVSMMEAQSAGIPIVATNVGGVNEIVREGTGFTLDADFDPPQLAGLINNFARLSMPDKEIMRKNAVDNWEKNFRASTNYAKFISIINTIFAKGIQKAGQ